MRGDKECPIYWRNLLTVAEIGGEVAEREAWRVGTDTGPIYRSMVQTPPTFSPFLISLMVSVDVKHHVYLLTLGHASNSG